MGFSAALWLHDVLLEVAKMSNDQNLFRSFREGNKIFVLQKQRNGKGRFVTITTLGDTKSKGSVIIPEGRDASGWNGVRQETSGIMDEQVHGKREASQRRLAPRYLTEQGHQVSTMVRENRTFKAVVTQEDMATTSVGITGHQGEASHRYTQEGPSAPADQARIEYGHVRGTGVATAAASQTIVSERDAKGVDKGKKPADILGEIPKIMQPSQPLFDKLTLNMDKFGLASSSTDTGLLQFTFQIQIARGLDGAWGVQQASIVEPPQSPFDQNCNKAEPIIGAVPKTNNTGQNNPDRNNTHLDFAKPKRSHTCVQRPKRVYRPIRQKWTWRPKARSNPASTKPDSSMAGPVGPSLSPETSSSLIPETSSSLDISNSSLDTPNSDPSSFTAVQQTAIIPHPGEVVTRTWGTASDWVLELRDGRRLSVPVSLLRPHLGEFQVMEPIIPTGMGELSVGGEISGLSSEYSGEEGDDEGDSVWVESEFSTGDGVVACWDGEEDPLEVLPLASVVPHAGVEPELVMRGEAEQDLPPSEWVMGKYQHFGDYVGASYERYEEEVLKLLKSIDAHRTNSEKGVVVPDINVRSSRKGGRELKGLVSTINYDTGSSRSRSNNRERVLMFGGLMTGIRGSKLEV